MSNIDNNVSISSVLVRTHLSINVHISISISSNIRINTNSNINMNVHTYIHTYKQNYIITYIHIYLNMCVCNSLYLDSYSYSILFGLSSTGAPHRSSASIWKAGEAHAAVLCRRAFLALEDSGLGVLGV